MRGKQKNYIAAVLALALLLCGCGTQAPAPTQTTAPTPVQTPEPTPVTKVQTDWSQLGERVVFTPVGGRWYADYTDRLIPSGDYGILIPYVGIRRSTPFWYDINHCLYGLMTRDGAVVTDPVFLSVTRPGFERGNWEAGGSEYRTHPMLVLSQATQDGQERYAVAGADGSWCTEFDYLEYSVCREGLLLVSEAGMVLMAPEGAVIDRYGWAELGFSEHEALMFQQGMHNYELSWQADYLVLGEENADNTLRCFRRSDRQPVALTERELEKLQQPNPPADFSLTQRNGETLVVRDGETYRIPHSTKGSVDICGDLLYYRGDGAVYTLAGEPLFPPLEDGYSELRWDELLGGAVPGLIYRYDRLTEERHYYRADGSPLPFLDHTAYCTLQIGLAGGLIYVLEPGTVRYYDYDTLDCVFRRSLGLQDD